MSALGGLALEGAGGALLAAAALHVRDAIRRTGQADVAAPARVALRLRELVARQADRYDRSPRGLRLAARLDAASIRKRPARWRATQVALLVPATAIALAAVGSLIAALSVAAAAIRLASFVLLRGRRQRRDEELTEVAATLARHFATELGSGSTPTESCASLEGTEETRSRPRLDALLSAATARVAVGESAVLALHRAIRELPAGRGQDVLELLASELELVVDRGCGTAVLTRFASGIEERRQTVAEVRAATAEIRMSTVAIPAMGLLVAGLLILTDPAVAGAALGPIGATVGLVLGGIAACATVVARRVTSPSEAL